MGAFVGLGLGCAFGAVGSTQGEAKKGKSQSMTVVIPLLILILAVLLATAQQSGLTDINFLITPDTFNWFPRSAAVSSLPQLEINVIWVIGVFLLIVTIFDAIGQQLGIEMAKYDPLHGYAVNLGGSLAGCIFYALLAYIGTSPGIWLSIGCACLMYFQRKIWQIALFVVAIVIAFCASSSSHWSPYYRIDLFPYMSNEELSGQKSIYRLGTKLEVNHALFQATVDLSDRYLQEHPDAKGISEFGTYNFPYEARPNPSTVLIMGGGTGNDAASAIRHGAKSIDMVEIDQVILQIGREIHPEKPYDNPSVHQFVNDARAFLASTQNKYDLIVFGFVDSHTAFSTVSSVRLDNYLYTKESLQEATKHLTPDGVAALSFAAGPPWLRARLYQMVKSVIGEEPLAMSSTLGNPNSIILLWGPGLKQTRAVLEKTRAGQLIPVSTLSPAVELCTDDWPFLYQQKREILPTYAIMLGFLILLSSIMIITRFRLDPKSFVSSGQFFFLGAGFLLLETRAMLTTSLLFGSTWIVNSIVISAVLIMALGANWIVSKYRNLPEWIGYTGIFASLLFMYCTPPSVVMELPLALRLIAGLFLVGLPFFFSGIVFSRAFAGVKDPARVLGINILGAVLGGCLEYFSVVIGSNNLLLMAMAIYAVSILCKLLPSARSDKTA